MAEAIGAASGLLTLSTVALDASIKLYTTVKGYQSHPKQVRDLLDELQALTDVLGPLTATASANIDVDLSALKFPLLQCGNACAELEKEINKCLPKPDSGKTSLRGWLRLRYMGDDINGFRGLISGYKLTISIALADAHLRTSSITAESIKAHEQLVKTAKDDLGAHLESLDEKMELILERTRTTEDRNSDETELQRLKDERLSTEKCLEICTRQCIDICSKADRRMRENVSNIVNHSTGDAVQFMVSTDGNIINGTNRGLGWRSRQVGGHLSDATVQQISRDFASVYLRHPENTTAAPHTTSPAQNPDESSYEFTQRYGRGSKLSPKSTP